jgi:hypothetical protein
MCTATVPHTHPGSPEINADLQDVAHVVHQEFDDRLDPRVIDECLARVAARFTQSTVRSFVPLLVLRYVREELQTRPHMRRPGSVPAPLAR